MKRSRLLVAALVITGFSIAACHTHRNEGPAEHAGSKIDKGLEKLGEKMQEGGQKLQDKAHSD